MTATTSFPLFRTSTISKSELLAWARDNGAGDDQDTRYLGALHDYCTEVGIDPAFAAGQWADETGTGDSVYWRRDGNPAGIGIWQSGVPSPWAGKLQPAESAAVHVAEILAHTVGIPDPNYQRAWLQDATYIDAAHLAKLAALRTVRSWPKPQRWELRHLCLEVGGGDYVWAANPNYAVQIARHIDRLYRYRKEAPVAGPFGNVKHPDYQDRPISKKEGQGQDDLGQRTVKGVVLHRIVGTLWGTDTYFRGPGVYALTDYGVGVGTADGAAHDGEILRWNDPLGRQSGWASGPYNGAYGDGLAFANKYGIDAINRDQASIEISGYYDTPLTDAARAAIAGIIAYWADQAHIPWDVFPITPADGFSFVRWHQEFTLGSGKICPGPVVMGETSALIEQARQIMRVAQTGGKPVRPPAYATPEVPDWFADSLSELHPSDQTEGDIKYRVLRRNFRVKVQTTRRSRPDATSPVSGPKLPVGELLHGERLVEANGKAFILTNDGHYVLESKVSPRASLKPW